MADPSTHTPVTRFAPSPTGHLHIGGARTALLCWAYARRHGGRFVLRIEDTDLKRSSEASAKGILEDLAWLGIHWDEGPEHDHQGTVIGGDARGVGPFRQSERFGHYNAAIDALLEADRAYPAFESVEELDAKRQEAIKNKTGYKYDRAALEIPREERLARLARGDDHVIRFRMPEAPIVVHDEILGGVRLEPEEFDDFIIRKRDGAPTYHLAVVVDDAKMGVTHVLRGQEHLINTPRHCAIQDALGYGRPVYAHMPLIFNPDGSKMSKRDKDKAAKNACKDASMASSPIDAVDDDAFSEWLSNKARQLDPVALREIATRLRIELPEIDVEDFRRSGYLPEALCNYLALLGWNPKTKNEDGTDLERFGTEYLATHFDLSGMGKGQAKFDRVKLLAFNADAIAALGDDGFAKRWRAWASQYDPTLNERFSAEQMRTLAPAVKTRCKTLADARSVLSFAFVDDDAIEYDGKAVHKALIKGGAKGLELLRAIRDELASVEPFEPQPIEHAVANFAEAQGVGIGKIAQPVRVAVTGSGVSPPLGQTLAIIGKDATLARIDRCVEHCAQQV